MPAYTRIDRGELIVTFHRDGHPRDRRIARNASDAWSQAIALLSLVAELRHGDQLTVLALPEAESAPEASRSSHYSG